MNYAQTVNRKPSDYNLFAATAAMLAPLGENADPRMYGIISGAIDFTLSQVDLNDKAFDKELCRTIHVYLYEVWGEFSWVEPYIWRGMDKGIERLKGVEA